MPTGGHLGGRRGPETVGGSGPLSAFGPARRQGISGPLASKLNHLAGRMARRYGAHPGWPRQARAAKGIEPGLGAASSGGLDTGLGGLALPTAEC